MNRLPAQGRLDAAGVGDQRRRVAGAARAFHHRQRPARHPFHALHHLFPTLPYHNLGIAHRRLREQLPPDSFYHLTVEPGLWAALKAHWRNTQSGEAIENQPSPSGA